MRPFRIEHLVAATHTPFNSSGELDLAIVEKQAQYLLDHGIKTVFVGGTTGESSSLTTSERLKLAQRWSEVIRSTEMRLVVHVGSNSLSDAKELASDAERCGAVAISALSPSYFKPPTVDVLVDCCAAIAQAAPRTPFYFYDIPSLTAVNLSMPQFLQKGAERIPNLVGLKFTNADFISFQQCLHVEQGNFDILWGIDEMLLAAMTLGAGGAVGSTYNFGAPIYARLLLALREGNIEQARQEQLDSIRLVQLLAKRGYMASAKELMKILGVNVGAPRLPIPSLTPSQTTELRVELEEFGMEKLG